MLVSLGGQTQFHPPETPTARLLFWARKPHTSQLAMSSQTRSLKDPTVYDRYWPRSFAVKRNLEGMCSDTPLQ